MRARGIQTVVAAVCGVLLLVAETGAQVTPDPVGMPGTVPNDPALMPGQTNPAPVVMPGAVQADPVLSPSQSQGAPVLRPGDVQADPASRPDQTRPDPVLSPTPGDSLAPLPPIFPQQN